jgi:hypothetical protein
LRLYVGGTHHPRGALVMSAKNFVESLHKAAVKVGRSHPRCAASATREIHRIHRRVAIHRHDYRAYSGEWRCADALENSY